jgi:hypothetical protein
MKEKVVGFLMQINKRSVGGILHRLAEPTQRDTQRAD